MKAAGLSSEAKRGLKHKCVRAVPAARSACRGSGNAHCSRTDNAEASRKYVTTTIVNTHVLPVAEYTYPQGHLPLSHP